MTQSQLECKTIACKFANIAYNSSQQVQLQLQWWCIISHASEYKRIVINYKPCTRANKQMNWLIEIVKQRSFRPYERTVAIYRNQNVFLSKYISKVVAKVSAIFKIRRLNKTIKKQFHKFLFSGANKYLKRESKTVPQVIEKQCTSMLCMCTIFQSNASLSALNPAQNFLYTYILVVERSWLYE